jgi:hypothetical protein
MADKMYPRSCTPERPVSYSDPSAVTGIRGVLVLTRTTACTSISPLIGEAHTTSAGNCEPQDPIQKGCDLSPPPETQLAT